MPVIQDQWGYSVRLANPQRAWFNVLCDTGECSHIFKAILGTWQNGRKKYWLYKNVTNGWGVFHLSTSSRVTMSPFFRALMAYSLPDFLYSASSTLDQEEEEKYWCLLTVIFLKTFAFILEFRQKLTGNGRRAKWGQHATKVLGQTWTGEVVIALSAS